MQLLREGKSFSGRERNCVFLNCETGQFANISAVSGLDFQDDGRAIAVSDWDHDGDVDLWLANRTSPRLRFMRNNGSQRKNNDFLVLKLQGTQSNRDGIGARVEVVLDAAHKRLVKTLSAGDGYLSQSSKFIHFGLGDADRVEQLTVRWPSGEFNQYSNVAAGKRYLLVEGRDKADELSARGSTPRLTAEPQDSLPRDDTARTAITSRPPLPNLRYKDFETQSEHELPLGESPVLLLLWASWCPTCVAEIQTIAQHAKQFEENELRIVALSVDELNPEASDPETVDKLHRSFGDRLEFGGATLEMVNKLQIIQRVVLNRQLPQAVPTSYLADHRGDLAFIYRGAVQTETLLHDLELLEVTPAERRDHAVPFPGIWTTPPRNLLLRPVANVFRDSGYVEDYDRLIQMEVDRLSGRRDSAASPEQRLALDRQFAVESFNLARSLQLQGQLADSIDCYRQGLQAYDQSAEAHFYLAKALRAKGEVSKATEHLRRAVQLDDSHVGAHFEMGVALAAREPDRAIKLFRRVVSLAPDHANGWTNLGALLARDAQRAEAIHAFQQALAIDPDSFRALVSLGGLYASNGQLDDAATQFRQATILRPHDAPSVAALGQVHLALDQPGPAAIALSRAVELNPKDTNSLLRLAWLRATSWDEAVRNGDEALRIATRLGQLAKSPNPVLLDLQGAALAALGQFERAEETAREALAATNEEQTQLRSAIERRIEHYTRRQPFRDKSRRTRRE